MGIPGRYDDTSKHHRKKKACLLQTPKTALKTNFLQRSKRALHAAVGSRTGYRCTVQRPGLQGRPSCCFPSRFSRPWRCGFSRVPPHRQGRHQPPDRPTLSPLPASQDQAFPKPAKSQPDCRDDSAQSPGVASRKPAVSGGQSAYRAHLSTQRACEEVADVPGASPGG